MSRKKNNILGNIRYWGSYYKCTWGVWIVITEQVRTQEDIYLALDSYFKLMLFEHDKRLNDNTAMLSYDGLRYWNHKT